MCVSSSQRRPDTACIQNGGTQCARLSILLCNTRIVHIIGLKSTLLETRNVFARVLALQASAPRVLSFCTGGANCALDKIPKKRSIEYTVAASRLYRDAASMMHGMVLAQAQKPLVSLLEENSVAQRHKGWEFGFLNGFGNETRQLNHLAWEVHPLIPPSLCSLRFVEGKVVAWRAESNVYR